MSEREVILDAINSAPNLTEAAKQLGASRRTLQNRMRHFAIPPGKAGRPREALPYSRSLAHPQAPARGGSAGEQLAFLGFLGGALLLGNWLMNRRTSVVGQKTSVGGHNPYLIGVDVLGAA